MIQRPGILFRFTSDVSVELKCSCLLAERLALGRSDVCLLGVGIISIT